MITWVRHLGIRQNEGRISLGLLVYSFVLGLSIAFFYTGATSLFLQNYSREFLPIGYIFGGVLALFVGLWVKRLQRSKSNTFVFRFILLLLFISTSGLIVLFWLLPAFRSVFIFLFFAWVRTYVYLLSLSFWGVANRLLNLRQGKRLFSFIGAGEVLSFLLSFGCIPILLRLDGISTEHILSFTIFAVLLVLIFGFWLLDTYKTQINLSENKVKVVDVQAQTKSSRYAKFMYAMAIFPIVAIVFVEFLFFAQSQVAFHNQGENLSSFLAVFFGVAALGEFLLKTFLSGRLISQFGLKFGLITLPVVLTFLFVIVSTTGFLFWLSVLFFPALALSRLFLRGLRSSFYEPSFQVLYQPVPEQERLFFQNAIEGKFKSIGNILSGLVLYELLNIQHISLFAISVIFLIICGVWVWVTFKMYAEYKNNVQVLLSSTSTVSKPVANAYPEISEVDANPTAVFVLWYLRESCQRDFESQLINYLQQHPHYGRFIQSCLTQNADSSFLAQLNQKLSQSHLIDQLAEKQRLGIDFWIEASHSSNVELRIKALSFLGASKRYAVHKIVLRHLRDSHSLVVKAAIRAAGKLNQPEVLPFLFELLKTSKYSVLALDSILQHKQDVSIDLIPFLAKNKVSKNMDRIILDRLCAFTSDNLNHYVRSRIFAPDFRVRNAALSLLAKKAYCISSLDRSQLIHFIDLEVKSILTLAYTFLDLQEQCLRALKTELEIDIKQRKENIFRLLSLLYDTATIQLIRDKLANGTVEAKSFAIEILDMTVAEELKQLVLPVLENNTPKELVQRYRDYWLYKPESEVIRLIDLMNISYYMLSFATRLKVLNLLVEFYKKEATPILHAIKVHSNPFLAETAQKHLGMRANSPMSDLYLQLRQLPLFNVNYSMDLSDLLAQYEPRTQSLVSNQQELFLYCIQSEVVVNQKHKFSQGQAVLLVSLNNIVIDAKSSSSYIIIETNDLLEFLALNTPLLPIWQSEVQLIEL